VSPLHNCTPVDYDRHSNRVEESALGAVVPVKMVNKNVEFLQHPSPANSKFDPDAARFKVIKRVETLLRDGIALLHKSAKQTGHAQPMSRTCECYMSMGAIMVQSGSSRITISPTPCEKE
jgi:hypothetical protein